MGQLAGRGPAVTRENARGSMVGAGLGGDAKNASFGKRAGVCVGEVWKQNVAEQGINRQVEGEDMAKTRGEHCVKNKFQN